MTYSEIENQVKQLSTTDQILLAEKILQWLRESAQHEVDPRQLPLADSGVSAQSTALRRGMLKPEGPLPTDEDLREDYTAFLVQKYLK
jgi:hypothetical protein